MSTEVQKFGNITRVIHQPGNMTKYEAVGVKMPDDFPENGGMWLVTFPLFGVSYFFREGCFLSVGYVAEKFEHQRNGIKIGEVDLNEMTKIITTITSGTHNAATNAQGYIPHLRVAQ